MSPHRDRPPPGLPWVLVTVGTLGVLGLYLAAVRTTTGQRVDTALMERALADESLAPRLQELVHLLGPLLMVPLAGAVALAGLARGWRTALGAGVGAAVCLALPQLLKATLPRPQLADPWPMGNSLPSGHTAAVAAVVVALLVVVPRTWRVPVLLLGSLATALMAALVVTLGHHRVSDVLASGAVALVGWGAGLLVQHGDPRPDAPQTTRSNTAASP